MTEYFGAPWSGRTHAAMHLTLGLLAVLGVQYMGDEWSATIAVWAHGRSPFALAVAPRLLVALAGVGALLFALGVGWRAAAVVFCASLAALYALAPVAYHNNLYLLWLFVLLTLVAGAPRYSPRALVLGDEPPAHTALFPRLVRWQVAIVYVGSVLVKATHPFWQGTGGVIRWLTLERVPVLNRGLLNPLLQPVFAHPAASAALDAGVMGAELIVPLMLFAPRLRRAGFAAGVALHAFMQEWLYPQLFTFLMLWGYYAFAPASDRAWRVSYDPGVPFDAGLARLYPRLDWLGRTRWEPAPGGALALTSPEGERRAGVAALRGLMVLTPATLVAFATLALAAPGTRQVLTLPRDAVENLVVLAWASLWVPGLWEPALARCRARRWAEE